MPQDGTPRTAMRSGLIESAGGQLKCPVCREMLTDVLMVSTTTEIGQTMVLPQESRTYYLRPGENPVREQGIAGLVVGLTCDHDHHVFLSLAALDGFITVKTEWEADQGEQREQRERD
jgi:hypothetical protein